MPSEENPKKILRTSMHNKAICSKLFNRFYGNYVWRISLKALGNYSDQFWSNKLSVLLLDTQTSSNSMTSGFLDPLGTLIYGF